MDQTSYIAATEAAAKTIRDLTDESRGQLDEDNQSHWDMARGVIRMWITLTGASGTIADLESLQLLLDDMPGVDDEGEGNFHATPVVVLPPKT